MGRNEREQSVGDDDEQARARSRSSGRMTYGIHCDAQSEMAGWPVCFKVAKGVGGRVGWAIGRRCGHERLGGREREFVRAGRVTGEKDLGTLARRKAGFKVWTRPASIGGCRLPPAWWAPRIGPSVEVGRSSQRMSSAAAWLTAWHGFLGILHCDLSPVPGVPPQSALPGGHSPLVAEGTECAIRIHARSVATTRSFRTGVEFI